METLDKSAECAIAMHVIGATDLCLVLATGIEADTGTTTSRSNKSRGGRSVEDSSTTDIHSEKKHEFPLFVQIVAFFERVDFFVRNVLVDKVYVVPDSNVNRAFLLNKIARFGVEYSRMGTTVAIVQTQRH